MVTNARTPVAPSVDRALSILEALADSNHGLTLMQLTRQLNLPKSSVHGLLATLEHRGYVTRNGRKGCYFIGLRLYGLSKLGLSRIDLREQAAPFLRKLMERTRLTVHMAILDAKAAVVVEKIEPPGLLRLATWVGRRMDLHCSGVGKALLAYMPEAELTELLQGYTLAHYTDNSIRTIKRLREEIIHIRQAGHAVDDEEGEMGFRCIGCPILGHNGEVRAAISLAGTIFQITEENLDALAAALKQTAASISNAIGYVPELSAGQSSSGK
ncbi:MAG TPA: IclR family transcriptional regulator [Terriglobia bacterium]|nr:IclR family transcriptional regulator [Terriglobia bacterium]